MKYKDYLPGYEEGRCAFFALGRNAMYAACRLLHIKPGDEVLTPAFDCDGSLQPFRVLGCNLKFYRSDPSTFSADIGDIKKQITSNTKLLHVINHFGMPQPWEKILEIREETKVPILEDNAYSLFSSYRGKRFGSFGDFSIFSLRKNLPLIDGGVLCVNNTKYDPEIQKKGAPLFYRTEANGVLTMIKRALGYYKTPEPLRRFVRRVDPAFGPPPPLYSEAEKGYPEWPWRDRVGIEFSCDYLRPMSRLARSQLERFTENDFAKIKSLKREYYALLADRLAGMKGIRVLWRELPEGVIPFCLSFLVESGRDNLLDRLRGRYDVMAWPTLPKVIIDRLEEYPEVELLGRKLLQINLPADKVITAGFRRYAQDLLRDIESLLKA